MDEFRVQDQTELPDCETQLVGIAKKPAKEQTEAKSIQQEAHLLNTFQSAHTLLLQCLIAKKKFDPNVLISFEEPCKYPEWRLAIGREYDAPMKKNNCSFAKLEPDMQSILLLRLPI